jgi:predicted  nucleic acid-binding Zn-ribbon protein
MKLQEEIADLYKRVQELERENGELRSVAEEAELNREAVKHAHSELAAIRKRIAEAPAAYTYARLAYVDDEAVVAIANHALAVRAKRVALLPLDDEAKS